MSTIPPNNFSFSSNASSSAYSFLDLNLTGTHPLSTEYNGPIIGYLEASDSGTLSFCDELSDAFHVELVDNMKNGELSKNALEWRCKVFGSIFGKEVEGPKARRGKKRKADDDEVEEKDVYMGSDEDEEIRGPNRRLEMQLFEEKPKVKKTAVKRMVGPAIPSALPKLPPKSPARAKTDAGVQKRRSTGRGKTPTRKYTWKDPQHKNKKKLYETSALAAGVTVEEYLAANNITVEGSSFNSSERTSNNDEFSDDEEMKNESSDTDHNEMIEDAQDELFVQGAGPCVKSKAPMMTDRRVAMLASQYFDELSKLADAEPVTDISIAVKSALQKVAAGASSELNAAEQVELHLAVERYETTITSY